MSSKIDCLSERQQRLLCRYFDGECSVLQYWSARRLIAGNAAAREYLRDLKIIEGIVCEKADDLPQIDLWGRISARIEAEEQAEVFLGGGLDSAKPGMAARIGEWFSEIRSGLTWAAGGASVASACALGLVYSGSFVDGDNSKVSVSNRSSPRTVISGAGSGANLGSLSPISLSKSEKLSFEREAEIAGTDFDTGPSRALVGSRGGAFPVKASQAPRAFEIDWVRSEGRLHLMQDPQAKTAIIWIKPRKSSAPAYTAARNSKRASRTQSAPIAVQVAGR